MRLHVLMMAGLISGSLVACAKVKRDADTPAPPAVTDVTVDPLVRELDEMGTPAHAWPPAQLELYSQRLDRIEYLSKQGKLTAPAGFIDVRRAQLDNFLIAAASVAPDSHACDGLAASGGSNAAFACLERLKPALANAAAATKAPADTCVDGPLAAEFKGQLASMEQRPVPRAPEPASPTRLRQALRMLLDYNAPCEALARRAHADEADLNKLRSALGCFEQIEPFIDDQVELARGENDTEALGLLKAELSVIDGFRVRLSLPPRHESK